jgi:hypothetical protein
LCQAVRRRLLRFHSGVPEDKHEYQVCLEGVSNWTGDVPSADGEAGTWWSAESDRFPAADVLSTQSAVLRREML